LSRDDLPVAPAHPRAQLPLSLSRAANQLHRLVAQLLPLSLSRAANQLRRPNGCRSHSLEPYPAAQGQLPNCCRSHRLEPQISCVAQPLPLSLSRAATNLYVASSHARVRARSSSTDLGTIRSRSSKVDRSEQNSARPSARYASGWPSRHALNAEHGGEQDPTDHNSRTRNNRRLCSSRLARAPPQRS
jgi:hypothetical protein